MLLIVFSEHVFALTFKDRLVVSVKNISYSQRHVELYIYIREALREKQPDNSHFEALDQGTWREVLLFFVGEIKILQEQQRLTVYSPPKRALAKARERISERTESNLLFSARLKNLQANDESIQKILQQILSVEFFRETRIKKNTLSDASDLNQNFKDQLLVRFFNKAFTYYPIQND